MSSATDNKLAMTLWDDQGALFIHDLIGQELLLVPIAFLVRSGVADNVKFITEQVLACYECTAGILSDSRGNEVGHADTLKAGSLTFIRTDNSEPLRPRKAGSLTFFATDDSKPLRPLGEPWYREELRALNEDDDSSTMSDSHRSTVDENFSEDLAARDAMCLVSGTVHNECSTCHIIPQSRPEYYHEILGYEPGHCFHARFALLLSDDLHHSFDRGEWALYPQGDDLIVHMFRPSNVEWTAYHGKVIPPSRFHTIVEDQPDRRLLLFHYHQCAMLRLRGN